MSSILERILCVNNIKVSSGSYLCTGCGKAIPLGQEYWDDLDLPWHFKCVPEVEVQVDILQEIDI